MERIRNESSRHDQRPAKKPPSPQMRGRRRAAPATSFMVRNNHDASAWAHFTAVVASSWEVQNSRDSCVCVKEATRQQNYLPGWVYIDNEKQKCLIRKKRSRLFDKYSSSHVSHIIHIPRHDEYYSCTQRQCNLQVILGWSVIPIMMIMMLNFRRMCWSSRCISRVSS